MKIEEVQRIQWPQNVNGQKDKHQSTKYYMKKKKIGQYESTKTIHFKITFNTIMFYYFTY